MRVNIAYVKLIVALLDDAQEAPLWLKEISHGIIPCRLRPALPAVLVVGDDFISRTGRAHPRVAALPARPPGMRRRDLIGTKCRLRMIAARRRAVPVVAVARR